MLSTRAIPSWEDGEGGEPYYAQGRSHGVNIVVVVSEWFFTLRLRNDSYFLSFLQKWQRNDKILSLVRIISFFRIEFIIRTDFQIYGSDRFPNLWFWSISILEDISIVSYGILTDRIDFYFFGSISIFLERFLLFLFRLLLFFTATITTTTSRCLLSHAPQRQCLVKARQNDR